MEFFYLLFQQNNKGVCIYKKLLLVRDHLWVYAYYIYYISKVSLKIKLSPKQLKMDDLGDRSYPDRIFIN